jgi:hypothetical protein
LAQIELNLLMFQIKNKIINVDTLNDKEYIDIGHRFATLINILTRQYIFRHLRHKLSPDQENIV